MKIYYSFDTNRMMTEEEAMKYVEEEILDDDYAIWEFIVGYYPYKDIIDNLYYDFLKIVVEKMIKKRLENPDYFLVREFPD